MEIITVTDTRELPSEPVYAYSLDKIHTAENAAGHFEARYQQAPSRCWQWMQYLYFEIPAVKGN